jgi:hypothetical protein
MINILLNMNNKTNDSKLALEDVDIHSFMWNEVISGEFNGMFQNKSVIELKNKVIMFLYNQDVEE